MALTSILCRTPSGCPSFHADTTCASFATDSFLVFTPDPPLFPVFLIEKLQMFHGFSKYLPFPYFFTFPNFPTISPKSNNGPTLLTFFQVFLGFQRWKHPSKLSKNPRGIRVDNPLDIRRKKISAILRNSFVS